MDKNNRIKKDRRIFQINYKMCCKRANTQPLKFLKSNGVSLELFTDKIKFVDWTPILIALGDDLSLQTVSIFCRSPKKFVMEQIDCERMAKNVTKFPVILTKFILTKLTEAITLCLSQSASLMTLQIDGLPLSTSYLTPISVALSVTSSLKHLSFQNSPLGDAGCLKICQALRCSSNIVTINVSGCEITYQGALYIADLIKFQKNYRYSETWKETLRDRCPDLDSMSGLRRVTLSGNHEIGDKGLLQILDVLLDDLWIKAIDAQQCGLTENSIKSCLQLLESNTTVRLIDLNYNAGINFKSLSNISKILRRNENGSCHEQQWFALSKHSYLNKEIIHPNVNAHIKDKKLDQKRMTCNKATLDLSFKSDSNLNKTKREAISLNILRDKLKEEITHRRQLEDLNERLLSQVKELKQQQIKLCKSGMYTSESEISNSSTITDNKIHKTFIDLTGIDHNVASSESSFKLKNKICTAVEIIEELFAQRQNS